MGITVCLCNSTLSTRNVQRYPSAFKGLHLYRTRSKCSTRHWYLHERHRSRSLLARQPSRPWLQVLGRTHRCCCWWVPAKVGDSLPAPLKSLTIQAVLSAMRYWQYLVFRKKNSQQFVEIKYNRFTGGCFQSQGHRFKVDCITNLRSLPPLYLSGLTSANCLETCLILKKCVFLFKLNQDKNLQKAYTVELYSDIAPGTYG